jgi:hypothetical protein
MTSSSNATPPPVRPGEPPLLAFVSSVMVDELQPARDKVVHVLDDAPFLLPWAFEYTPASSEALDWSYLEKVRRAAFVFWLVGASTTDPVEREINEAVSANRRLIIMLLPAASRDERTEQLIKRVRAHAKYREPADLDQLAIEVNLAVSDEIARALQDVRGMARGARLDELGRASRARCIERWQAAGVDTALALHLAQDVSVGALPGEGWPTEAMPLVILRGDVGIGKSLAAERWHQAAIASQLGEAGAPVALYLRARDLVNDLRTASENAAEGLGDPRQQGAAVVIDGADEPGVGAAADLLRQARELSRTWPATRVLMTSRPVSTLAGAQETFPLPRLGPDGARALVGRVAGLEVTLGREAGWPDGLRDAIQLPLFAVLLGASLRRTGGQMPGSRADLIRDLVEEAIGRVAGDASPSLRRLAMLSLQRGGGPVPEAEVAAPSELEQIEETRLVVARDRTLVFPLIVIAQWFAAESLIHGEPNIAELVRHPEILENWRYPLAIVAGAYDHARVTEVIGPLAAAHAGFASQVIEEGLARWSNVEDVLPPDANECGQRVRESTGRWLVGVGPLAAHVGPVRADGELLPVGTHVSGHWLTTGWYVGKEPVDAVTALPSGLFGFLAASDPAAMEWTAVRGARPGRQAAWAWRWSFEQLRDALESVLNARRLQLLDGPLAESKLWTTATALLDLSFLHNEPILIEPLIEAIPPDADVVINAKGRLVSTAGFTDALRQRFERGQAELAPPLPGPDRMFGGGFIWDPWSDTQLLERTRAVYELALHGYTNVTDTLVSSLAPWMQTAVTLPALLHGRLHPAEIGGGAFGGPTMTWWLEAIPAGEASQIAIEIEHVEDRDLWGEIGHDLVIRARSLRPRQARWLDATLHSGFLEIFQPWAAEEIVYKWIWDDLKRIRWVDGVLRGRPTGYGGIL